MVWQQFGGGLNRGAASKSGVAAIQGALTLRGTATSRGRTTTNLMELDLEILIKEKRFCSLLQFWEQFAVLEGVCNYFFVRKLSLL